MYQKIITIVIISLVVLNCSHSNIEQKINEEETPQVLLENSNSSYWSKRGYDDIIDRLFKEAVEGNSGLNALLIEMDKANEIKNEILGDFQKFDHNNHGYYTMANQYISQVQDSVTKNHLEVDTKKLLDEYETFTKEHTELLTEISEAEKLWNDQLISLKLIVTEKMMATYRENELLPLKNLHNILTKYSDLNVEIKSLLE